jgi:hypothetical protein
VNFHVAHLFFNERGMWNRITGVLVGVAIMAATERGLGFVWYWAFLFGVLAYFAVRYADPIFAGMLTSSRVDCIRIVRCIVVRFLIVTLALLGAAHGQTPSRCPELMQLNTDAEASLGKS